MKNRPLSEIKDLVQDCEICGIQDQLFFSGFTTIENATEESVIWIKAGRKDIEEVLLTTKARIIVLPHDANIPDSIKNEKCLILSKKPKLTFLRLAKAFSDNNISWGIHPTAFIHEDAIVHPQSYIGPFTYIGRSVIGKGTVIYGHCYIYDNVRMGENIEIHAGTIIGADGFGYEKNADGEYEKFPHIGGVVIEDNVDIGANTCIDRGALGDTILRKGAKIDNLVHIAHNVIVGKNAMVIANSMIGGSTTIGDNAWISPSVSLMNGIAVKNNAIAGLGAVVTKDIPDGQTWAGIPARELKEFVAQQKELKKLADNSQK